MRITKYTLPVVIVLIALIALTGCKKRRITYVQMVDREETEIQSFMNTQGIRVINDFPREKVTDEHTFVQILEGVYLRVIDPGKGKPESGKTVIHARCKVRSITPRDKFEYDNISGNTGGTSPVSFVFNKTREIIAPDPKATSDESSNTGLACAAMQEALKYVGDGSSVQIITTFREGPSFTTQLGTPLFYERLTFNFKK